MQKMCTSLPIVFILSHFWISYVQFSVPALQYFPSIINLKSVFVQLSYASDLILYETLEALKTNLAQTYHILFSQNLINFFSLSDELHS